MREQSDMEPINILCATDENYAPYCGIMLTSLFESNKEHHFDVYLLLSSSLAKRNKEKYGKLERKYGCKIIYVTVDVRFLKLFKTNRDNSIDNHTWVTTPTYFRLLAAKLLPDYVRKVLYLDCDVVVNGDIGPLWRTDLTDNAVACVADCDWNANCERMGFAAEDVYFNAGVAVYNLDYWRKNNITEAFFDYMRLGGSQLLLMDQDVMNVVLRDKKTLVPERYNFQVAFFSKTFWESYSASFRENLLLENRRALIVHYVGGIKPWDYRYYGSPYYAIWANYRKKSLWKRNHITNPLSKYVKFILKKCILAKSLKRKRQTVWIVLPENKFCFD